MSSLADARTNSLVLPSESWVAAPAARPVPASPSAMPADRRFSIISASGSQPRGRGGDGDSDGDSSVGYDAETGEPVLDTDRQLARFKAEMEMRTQALAAKPAIAPVQVRSAMSRRHRSRFALDRARDDVAVRQGAPPRMIVEPTYGMLLPRESVVTAAAPLTYTDEFGTLVTVQAPPVGFAADGRVSALEIERAAAEGQRTHYRRSVDALNISRQERVFRALESL